MATTTVESLSPPQAPGALEWLRKNLFNNWFNSLLTVVLGLGILWALNGAVSWIFFTANWRPVINHPLLYLVGQYPRDQIWRVGACLLVISFLLGVSWGKWGGVMRTVSIAQILFVLAYVFWPARAESLTLPIRLFFATNVPAILLGYLSGGLRFMRPRVVLLAWVLSSGVVIALLRGSAATPWLPLVPTGQWGGLIVTMILAVGGIVLSFPIGVLLALGRRSSLPVVSLFSTVFIEVVRGVPLISILFLVSLLVPLFLPTELRIDRMVRALVAMTVFSAAYMAENVRGGLAAIPQGQIEAARAVGLNSFQVTALIVLPQALRMVIPPIVGQFISLFKDTTLAAGIAVVELLSIARSIQQLNPEYLRLQTEIYLFIAAIFWIFCYLMSYASLRLEAALGVGER